MKRFLSRLCLILSLKRLAFFAAAFATLVAAFYIIENWRGEKAWARTKAALQAQGRPLTYEDILPSPPPDDENFVMSPVLVKWCGFGQSSPPKPVSFDFKPKPSGRPGAPKDDTWESNLWETLWVMPPKDRPDWPRLAALLTSETAAALTPEEAARLVLQTFAEHEPDFVALAKEARSRPHVSIPLDWKNWYLDNEDTYQPISNWFGLARAVQVRAMAQITLRDADGALGSLEILFRLVESCQADPQLLIMFVLARGLDSSCLIPALWQGWNARLWNADQWQRLAELAAKKHLTADLQRAYATDLVWGMALTEEMAAGKPTPHLPSFFSWSIFPRGWFRQNQVSLVEALDRLQQRLDLPISERPAPEDYRKKNGAFRWRNWSPYTLFARVAVQGLTGIENTTNEMEALWAVTRVGVALERHRLQHGRFPATLEELTAGEFAVSLTDPFTGRPLRYRLNGDHPVVWSQGEGPALPQDAWPDPDHGHIVWGIAPTQKETGR